MVVLLLGWMMRLVVCLPVCVIDWSVGWGGVWLSGVTIVWVCGCLLACLAVWLSGWLSVFVAACLTGCLIGWAAGGLAGWLRGSDRLRIHGLLGFLERWLFVWRAG